MNTPSAPLRRIKHSIRFSQGLLTGLSFSVMIPLAQKHDRLPGTSIMPKHDLCTCFFF
jgi:hypothetical protein